MIIWIARGGFVSHSDATNSIDYQGESIKLSKSYSDYDEYKQDPNNITANEITKVQRLVETAPVAKHFASRQVMSSAMFALQFPGYGIEAGGATPQADGSILELWGVEIPRAAKTRYLLFRGRNGVYDLADDFVQSDALMIGSARVVGDKLVYSTQQGAKVVERTMSAK